ncbi:hypothetical protein DRJ17_02685 [Candidatus Woesearchaeota archaeon]|nr:MAG: hypothetical protein DRJ17_02685 [Candidatus Woesearchaeota archaeon]
MSTSLNIKVEDYTNRVLGVIKEKFGLKDKAEALDKFADLFGEEFVEKEVDEKIVNEVIESCNRHIKKHGFRKMNSKELDKLCGIE